MTTLETRPSALVTGGSRGIGFGIARLLVERGFAVTITARHREQLDAASERLREGGGEVSAVAGDMADDDDMADVLRQHERTFGTLSMLVLSAGIGTGGGISGYPLNRLDKQWAVNARAPFALLAAALPLLRTTAAASPGGRSRVVAVSSIEGVYPQPWLAAYAATKAALISMVRSVNVEENQHGVLATAVSPGFVDTDLAAWTTDTIPADTMISVADVVRVVALLLDLSPYANLDHLVVHRVGAGPYDA